MVENELRTICQVEALRSNSLNLLSQPPNDLDLKDPSAK